MRTQIVIHHSADPSTSPQFDKINGYHKSKGFPRSSLGFYVGYNWLVEHDGQLKQARGLNDHGAHTDAMCDGGHCNLVAYGVCLSGDFTRNLPTPGQCATLYDLWKSLNYPKLLLHSDVKQTSCPGDFDFRNELTRRYYADLNQGLKNAMAALPRFLGSARGSMLSRLIDRLRKTIGGNEGG